MPTDIPDVWPDCVECGGTGFVDRDGSCGPYDADCPACPERTIAALRARVVELSVAPIRCSGETITVEAATVPTFVVPNYADRLPMRFTGENGRKPSTEARRYVAACVAASIDNDLGDSNGWVLCGLTDPHDVRRARDAARRLKARLMKEATR